MGGRRTRSRAKGWVRVMGESPVVRSSQPTAMGEPQTPQTPAAADERARVVVGKVGKAPVREAFPYPHAMAELTERAVALTARLFGSGIARMIAHYVPPEHAGRFAAHLAEELLHEVLPPYADADAATARRFARP